MSERDSDSDLSQGEPVESIPQVGESRGETLRENGYQVVGDVQRATVDELDGLFVTAIAHQIKANAGDVPSNPSNVTEAKQRAKGRPGAKVKTVRVGGSQQTRVLEKEQEKDIGGAHMTVHKG